MPVPGWLAFLMAVLIILIFLAVAGVINFN